MCIIEKIEVTFSEVMCDVCRKIYRSDKFAKINKAMQKEATMDDNSDEVRAELKDTEYMNICHGCV